MAGAAIGASAASANAQAASASSYSAGYAAGSANTTATTNAYAAGVATGMSIASQPAGTVITVLPAAAVHTTISGTTYYVSNGAWYLPSSSANGVVYTVVPAP